MSGSAARRIAQRIPPPVYFFACLLGGWGLDRALPLALGLESLASRLVAGGSLIASAATLGAWSLLLFRRARTSPLPFGTPTALLTCGPFGWSRNPLYLALALVLGGLAAALDNGWIAASVAALVLLLDRFIVPGEERRLHERFGDDYVAYRRSVRKWI